MGLLFVYGTLKQGERNNHRLSGRFVRRVCTEPKFKLVDFGTFPGLTNGNQAIVGELWEVDESLFRMLDVFEGVHRGVYERQLIQLEDGIEANAYVCQKAMPDYEGTDWHER